MDNNINLRLLSTKLVEDFKFVEYSILTEVNESKIVNNFENVLFNFNDNLFRLVLYTEKLILICYNKLDYRFVSVLLLNIDIFSDDIKNENINNDNLLNVWLKTQKLMILRLKIKIRQIINSEKLIIDIYKEIIELFINFLQHGLNIIKSINNENMKLEIDKFSDEEYVKCLQQTITNNIR